MLVAFSVSPWVNPAAGQTDTTIEAINIDVTDWLLDFVRIEGVLVADGDRVELWSDLRVSERTTSLVWNHHVKLVGAGLPVDPTLENGARWELEGIVATAAVEDDGFGMQVVGEIEVTSWTQLESPMPIPPLPPPPSPGPGDACKDCHFAIIISGYKQADYWNDVKQKYDYKKTTLDVCPANIVVLYDGGSANVAQIPNGTLGVGGAFTSGGVFDTSRDHVTKAFAYIKATMIANNCANPEFQFHSTGHGGGYQTVAGQDNAATTAEGWQGGVLDASGDEAETISENDLIFKVQGTHDLDGDGTDDVHVFVDKNNGNKLTVKLDGPDVNPNFDVAVGVDTNGDGIVSKADGGGNWAAPDIDGSGGLSNVKFDEVLSLGDSEVLLDDELKALIKGLQTGTNLKKDKTRAELAQCFSGGFHRDLKDVCKETTSGAGEGEYSYSQRGVNGFNRYENPFIASLVAGNSWKDAHTAAVTSVTNAETTAAAGTNPFNETPAYQRNSFQDLGFGLGGVLGEPFLLGDGSLEPASPLSIGLTNTIPNFFAFLAVGITPLFAPLEGGTLVPDITPPGAVLFLPTNPTGSIPLNSLWPTGVPPGFEIYLQYWIQDPTGPFGWTVSNGIQGTTP